MVLIQSGFSSIVYDFIARLSGKSILRLDFYSSLPFKESPLKAERMIRTLLLNCINKDYSELWKKCWKQDFTHDSWTSFDSRLKRDVFKNLKSVWNCNMVVKSDYARRQLLVETDVLNAMVLGLNLKELQTIYRLYFPVLKNMNLILGMMLMVILSLPRPIQA